MLSNFVDMDNGVTIGSNGHLSLLERQHQHKRIYWSSVYARCDQTTMNVSSRLSLKLALILTTGVFAWLSFSFGYRLSLPIVNQRCLSAAYTGEVNFVSIVVLPTS